MSVHFNFNQFLNPKTKNIARKVKRGHNDITARMQNISKCCLAMIEVGLMDDGEYNLVVRGSSKH